MTPKTHRVGTNVLLIREGKVLLTRRVNTGQADGMLGIPGGHLTKGETARQAAVREIKEELGTIIDEQRLIFFTTVILRSNHEYVNQEFYVELRPGEEPINAEPEVCSELVWCDPSDLPEDIPDLFRTIILRGYVGGEHYLEVGY